MKQVYCAKCHTRLPITRRVLKESKVIIDTVEPHTCPDVPLTFDLLPIESAVPAFVDQTVQNLNKPHGLTTADLRDRRNTADVKSDIDTMAPIGVLEQIKRMRGDDA